MRILRPGPLVGLFCTTGVCTVARGLCNDADAACVNCVCKNFHPLRNARPAKPATMGSTAFPTCTGNDVLCIGNPLLVSKPQAPQKRALRATDPPHWGQIRLTSLIFSPFSFCTGCEYSTSAPSLQTTQKQRTARKNPTTKINETLFLVDKL